jgi:hypothetical protein
MRGIAGSRGRGRQILALCHRSAQDQTRRRRAVPLRRTVAGGAIGREALDCRHGERRRIKPGKALPREPLDAATCRTPRRAVPLRRTDAGGAIGRKALDAGTIASGASVKPSEPGEALHREPLDAADVPCPSTCRAAMPGQDRRRWCDRPRRVAGTATVPSGSRIKNATLARHSAAQPAARNRVTCPFASAIEGAPAAPVTKIGGCL